MTDKFEPGKRDVGLTPREVAVEADHLITGLHQTVDQVGAKEAGTASDEVDLHPQGEQFFHDRGNWRKRNGGFSACCFNGLRRTSPRSAFVSEHHGPARTTAIRPFELLAESRARRIQLHPKPSGGAGPVPKPERHARPRHHDYEKDIRAAAAVS